MQAYSDPKRADDPNSLPDVEVWQEKRREFYCSHCGASFEMPVSFEYQTCFDCGHELKPGGIGKPAWWFWWCFPGCLPDSDIFGPYETLEAARADWEEDE